jgi:hypothetical protein
MILMRAIRFCRVEDNILKRTLALVSVLCICILTINASASSPFSDRFSNLENHEIQIQTLSFKAYTIDCHEGDVLFGEFEVVSDGDLYPGDQRKYDIWLGWGNGVDFYIFDQNNYDSWILGEEAISKFEKTDATSLSWSINVDESGTWYVVYINDSPTYIKTVKGSIQHTNAIDNLLIFVGLLGGIIVFILIILVWCKIKKQ